MISEVFDKFFALINSRKLHKISSNLKELLNTPFKLSLILLDYLQSKKV